MKCTNSCHCSHGFKNLFLELKILLTHPKYPTTQILHQKQLISTKNRFRVNFLTIKLTPKQRNRNLTSQIYQSQIQQSTSSGSDPDQKVRCSNICILSYFYQILALDDLKDCKLGSSMIIFRHFREFSVLKGRIFGNFRIFLGNIHF